MDEGHAAHAKLGFRTTLPDTSIVLEAKTPLLATSSLLCPVVPLVRAQRKC